MPALLEVRGLRTEFRSPRGVVRAVNGVEFTLAAGETLGIVGESGSGKSVSTLSIMRLLPESATITGGEVWFEGKNLLRLSDAEMRRVRGRDIAMIFQDPMTSLNPVLTIGWQICEALEQHLHLARSRARARAIELLDVVGIPEPARRVDDYPHQFSGGMRQRAMIAMALACTPKLLIADEPTTALDVTIQAQILDLMRRLQREFNTAMIWISHDLGVIAGLADRVIVMYAGSVVESATVDGLFRQPSHPYTLGLLDSIPRLDEDRPDRLRPIDGAPPDLTRAMVGCPFVPRCTFRVARCQSEAPPLAASESDGEHRAACWESPQVYQVVEARDR
ncbi:MAG TPA: ABC transporter ATP-binding protein [Chloroflexota bacterium]|nr:ABC transporter ATP-binding protein [Chloroflexota bacterium]